MLSKLCLGTAQLGMQYGITNKHKFSSHDASEILRCAYSNGIRSFDTAVDYGSSQSILNHVLGKKSNVEINSKLTNKHTKSLDIDLRKWFKQIFPFDAISSLYAHKASDIYSSESRLLDILRELKEIGLIKSIGASVYTKEELISLPLQYIDCIQLPLSIFDQRFIHDGSINMLQDLNISIHVRSIFMQGLLLIPTFEWPKGFSTSILNAHQRLTSFVLDTDISLLQACTNFAAHHADKVLVGVSSQQELSEIVSTFKTNEKNSVNPNLFYDYAVNSIEIDPRSWAQ